MHISSLYELKHISTPTQNKLPQQSKMHTAAWRHSCASQSNQVSSCCSTHDWIRLQLVALFPVCNFEYTLPQTKWKFCTFTFLSLCLHSDALWVILWPFNCVHFFYVSCGSTESVSFVYFSGTLVINLSFHWSLMWQMQTDSIGTILILIHISVISVKWYIHQSDHNPPFIFHNLFHNVHRLNKISRLTAFACSS